MPTASMCGRAGRRAAPTPVFCSAACKGCRDYIGGPNHFTSLDLLHDRAALANLIRWHMEP